MKVLGILFFVLSSRCFAQEEDLRRFLDGLHKPVIMDTDAQRKHAPKGRMLVDNIVIYALRDSGGKRFCVSYYGHYGKRWLTERKQGLFIVLPRPVEQYGWGGFGPARHSLEEAEIAKMLADASHMKPNAFLKSAK